MGMSKDNNQIVTEESPFEIGKTYLIRTVTHYQCGTVSKICNPFIVLKNAAWIADTGRLHNALSTGEFNEVEPFVNSVIVNTGAIVDATEITNPKISSQK